MAHPTRNPAVAPTQQPQRARLLQHNAQSASAQNKPLQNNNGTFLAWLKTQAEQSTSTTPSTPKADTSQSRAPQPTIPVTGSATDSGGTYGTTFTHDQIDDTLPADPLLPGQIIVQHPRQLQVDSLSMACAMGQQRREKMAGHALLASQQHRICVESTRSA